MKNQQNISIKDAELTLQQIKTHEHYMLEAVKQAKKAAANKDVPIGCVIVHDNKIIARAYNKRNKLNSSLAHAEIIAIRKACKVIEDWRLEECTMYITLEPCQMCAGAIIQSRIPCVIIGAMNPKAGCAGSIIDLLHVERFNHSPYTLHGILEPECASLMKDFFSSLRKKNI